MNEQSADSRTQERDAILRELSKWASQPVIPLPWQLGFLFIFVAALVAGTLLWLLAPTELLARLQTFNGAITIPVGAVAFFSFSSFVIMIPMKQLQLLVARVMRYSMDVTEGMSDKMQQSLERARLDFSEMGGKIHGELKRVGDAFNRKIEAPVRRIEAPTVVSFDGNGKDNGGSAG